MSSSSPESLPSRGGRVRRVALGSLLLALGLAALATPFVAGKSAPVALGLLLLASGVLQLLQTFLLRDRRLRNSALFGSAVSILAGALLIALPKLVFAALTLLHGLSFLLGGLVEVAAALRGKSDREAGLALIDGLINVALGLSIAAQWPLSGVWAIGVYVGIRILASGWSITLGRADVVGGPEGPGSHPDALLRLPPHPELTRILKAVTDEEEAGARVGRYWRTVFVLVFFAIHVGRMDAEWNLVGLFSPAVAVVGDVCFALVLAYAVITPPRLGWRTLTRGLERRTWERLLSRVDQGRGSGVRDRYTRWWLAGRLRFSLRMTRVRRSPTAALGQGLQVGLPLVAVLIATNPIWGFSWYFNTENWATGLWESWAEHRTDDWRAEMMRAVREEYRPQGIVEPDLLRVAPEGVAGAADFSFLVIGDPGEGDPSQHVLRDQFLLLGQRPDVKFLVVSSDVIYPSGSMKDYESKFYLPFKGFTKPIYGLPGNHDWYDALEAFTANFFEPDAARAAMRARRAMDRGLTSTTESRIEQMIAEAARLREEYGVRTGLQRGPFFEIQAERFSLVVADTGIRRTMDDDQRAWLAGALDRSRGKFKLVIPGHPLYAGGRYQGELDEEFASLHRLLREHEVDVVMAGDTHDFEHYRESYEAAGKSRVMSHFVNGGGGAYLSIGTALGWPSQPPVPDCAIYPRKDAIIAKLDRQTPLWKRPLWFWVKRLGAWPSSPEAVASAFDFNQAPFFQSFVEVRVEGSANVVRLLPYGARGRLRWADLQVYGRVIPEGQDENSPVEFTFPMTKRTGR
jgi:uncharacterized membrane protein HdeD (DUF308 family)